MKNSAFKKKMKSEYSGEGRSKKEAFKKPLTPEDLLELAQPVLSDFIYICHNLPSDEQRQINALSGMEVYDAEQTA